MKGKGFIPCRSPEKMGDSWCKGPPSTSLQAEVFKGGRGKQREDTKEAGGQSSTGRPAPSTLTRVSKLVK